MDYFLWIVDKIHYNEAAARLGITLLG